MSDGVWGSLSHEALEEAIRGVDQEGQGIGALLELALKSGSEDNITALWVKVLALGSDTLRDRLLSNQSRQIGRAHV